MSFPYSKVAVFGAGGQVGSALCGLLGEKAIPLFHKEGDFTQPETLAAVLDRIQPDAVINAAAYTQVDKAQDEPEVAALINADAPGALARWCAAHHVPFVHYSTDYVFNGTGERPWEEDDTTDPLSVYGKTKRDGEDAVAAAGGAFLIFRTSWVYDALGKNFLNTMLRVGAERETLTVVADQYGAPCFAPHLAQATLECLEKAAPMESFPFGIYHLVNQGETTWYGFAEAIFEAARKKGLPVAVKTVEPIPSSAYPTPATRPHNSRLSTTKFQSVFHFLLPHWQEGLAQAIEDKYASH